MKTRAKALIGFAIIFIFCGTASATISPVVVSGQAVPGMADVTYTGVGKASVNKSGDMAFRTHLSNGAACIFKLSHGQSSVVAISGQTVPESSTTAFGEIGSPVMNDSGSMAFYATVQNLDLPTIPIHEVLFIAEGGSIRKVLDPKTVLPDVEHLIALQFNNRGDIAVHATFTSGGQALLVISNGELRNVIAGVRKFSLNNMGDIAYIRSSDDAIYLLSGTTTQRIVRKGQSVPNTDITLDDLSESDVSMNDSGEIVFINYHYVEYQLVGRGGGGSYLANALVRWREGTLEKIAVPGFDNKTSGNFREPLIDNLGRVYFYFQPSGSKSSMFRFDDGNFRLLMQEDQTVEGVGTLSLTGFADINDSGIVTFISNILSDSGTQLYGIFKINSHPLFADLVIGSGGFAQTSTAGDYPDTQKGYAMGAIKSGMAPFGTAVFSFKEGGVTVSEAGVPASPPTTSSRVFIEYRSGVNVVPARDDAGTVDVNTGIAVVNYGTAPANVTYTLRNASGNAITTGHGTMAAGQHISCFIDQFASVVAPDFNLPANFQADIRFGTLDIASDQPLSVLALRGTTNQRQQFIFTTTPVADLTQAPGSGPIYFAQLGDGGGYTTSLILMNTSDTNETGTFKIMDNNGYPLAANQVGGPSGSSFTYSIPPTGIFHFQTDGSPGEVNVGWVQLTPDPGTSTPVGSGVFGYNPVDVLITESGVPSTTATTHARIYVDRSNNHDTGLAISNIDNVSANITIRAFQSDGVTAAGTSVGPLTLDAHGHDSAFAGKYVTDLPSGFTGVLDISSSVQFTALTMRSLYNENNDYLMATFPIADFYQTAPSPIIFPHIVDGGGYVTEFILLSMDGESSTTINYYDNEGAPLAVGR